MTNKVIIIIDKLTSLFCCGHKSIKQVGAWILYSLPIYSVLLLEMSEEFPSRKKAKIQSNSNKKNKTNLVALKHHQEKSVFSTQNKNDETHTIKVKAMPKQVSVSEAKPKTSSTSALASASISATSSNSLLPDSSKSDYQSQNSGKTNITPMKTNVKQEINTPALPVPVKVKPDPDAQTEFSIAMQRAMKIK